jgi:hypothetical protein
MMTKIKEKNKINKIADIALKMLFTGDFVS